MCAIVQCHADMVSWYAQLDAMVIDVELSTEHYL